MFHRSLFFAALAGVLVTPFASAADGASRAALESQAKISQAVAQETALREVPGGKVASAELEREHGKLVWSFDIKKKASRDIAEIQIDAISGAVVSHEIENPHAQAKEAAADRKPSRQH